MVESEADNEASSYSRNYNTNAIQFENITFFIFAQILDGALCRAFKIQREFVSPLQITHLAPVWDLSLDRSDHRLLVFLPKDTGKYGVNEIA